jgi:hypothetical protein
VGLNQRAQEWTQRATEWRKQSFGKSNTVEDIR